MTYAAAHWFRHSNYIAVGKLKATMKIYIDMINKYQICKWILVCSNLHGRALRARAPRRYGAGPPTPGWQDVCDGVTEQGRLVHLGDPGDHCVTVRGCTTAGSASPAAAAPPLRVSSRMFAGFRGLRSSPTLGGSGILNFMAYWLGRTPCRCHQAVKTSCSRSC